MQLPIAPGVYSPTDQAQMRGILEREDKRNMKLGGDIIIAAPNGSRWKLVVDNAGALTTVAA